jgi:D-glycero-alpha-D-manno-heptose-7-phosphate kinase
MIFFTGLSRNASDVAKEQIKNIHSKNSELRAMHGMVDESVKILTSSGSLNDFGKLLHESWKLKRGLSSAITTSFIDNIYDVALSRGALGGKLLGAGSGGFILFFVKPEDRQNVKESLKDLLHVPFSFESLGSQIIHYSP